MPKPRPCPTTRPLGPVLSPRRGPQPHSCQAPPIPSSSYSHPSEGLASLLEFPHPQPSASSLNDSPPHLRSSSLSQALAGPSRCYSKAQPFRPCTGSGLRFLPFRTLPPITSPLHRPISNHVPSPLPQSISSAVLTPTDTRRPRRRRICNCSLCTRGSWRGAVWGGGTPALA